MRRTLQALLFAFLFWSIVFWFLHLFAQKGKSHGDNKLAHPSASSPMKEKKLKLNSGKWQTVKPYKHVHCVIIVTGSGGKTGSEMRNIWGKDITEWGQRQNTAGIFSHHVGGENEDPLVLSARPLRVVQQVGVVLAKVPHLVPCRAQRGQRRLRTAVPYGRLSAVDSPVSKLLWLLLAWPKLRLRWLALRDWAKDAVESMVFLLPPSTLVGYRNWV